MGDRWTVFVGRLSWRCVAWCCWVEMSPWPEQPFRGRKACWNDQLWVSVRRVAACEKPSASYMLALSLEASGISAPGDSS